MHSHTQLSQRSIKLKSFPGVSTKTDKLLGFAMLVLNGYMAVSFMPV